MELALSPLKYNADDAGYIGGGEQVVKELFEPIAAQTEYASKFESKIEFGPENESPLPGTNIGDYVRDEDLEEIRHVINATESVGSSSTSQSPVKKELRPRKVKEEPKEEEPKPKAVKLKVKFSADAKERDGDGHSSKKHRGGQGGPRGRDADGNPVKLSYNKRNGPTVIDLASSPPESSKSRGGSLKVESGLVPLTVSQPLCSGPCPAFAVCNVG